MAIETDVIPNTIHLMSSQAISLSKITKTLMIFHMHDYKPVFQGMDNG